MQNISIRARLIANLLIFVIILISVGSYFFHRISELTDSSNLLYYYDTAIEDSAFNFRESISAIQQHLKDAVLAETREEKQKYITEIKAHEIVALDKLNNIKETIHSPEGENYEKRLRNLFLTWKPFKETIVNDIYSGKDEIAWQLIQTADRKIVNQLFEEERDFQQYLKAQKEVILNDIIETKTKAQYTIIWLIVVLILFAVVVNYFLIRSISTPMQKFRQTLELNTSTKELNPVDLPGNNEISQLASWFNELITQIKKQTWLFIGINTLYSKIYSSINPTQVNDSIINYLSRYLDCVWGAFYVCSPKTKHLSLVATYGNSKKNSLLSSVSIGESLIGQAAQDLEPIILKDVQDKQLSIKTNFLSTGGFSVCIFPISIQNKPFGVLELVSIKEFDENKLNFLRISAQILSTYIIFNEQNKKITDKEREVTLQNKELQAKEQELIIQNRHLQRQEEKLKQQNENYEKLNRELERSKKDLQSAHEHKNRFFSSMSHELRTPLNAIIGFTELLQKEYYGKVNEHQAEYLHLIHNSSTHLLSLINDILDITKIDSGVVEFEYQDTDLNATIAEIIELLAVQLSRKEIKMTSPPGSTPYILKSDPRKLKQILINLLSNAVKYTPQKGEIIVKTEEIGNFVKISVIDNGVGIDSASLPYVFSEFYQVDQERDQEYGGIGVGLSITKRFVERLGGEIGAESKVDIGSTFWFTLPLKLSGGKSASLSLANQIK